MLESSTVPIFELISRPVWSFSRSRAMRVTTDSSVMARVFRLRPDIFLPLCVASCGLLLRGCDAVLCCFVLWPSFKSKEKEKWQQKKNGNFLSLTSSSFIMHPRFSRSDCEGCGKGELRFVSRGSHENASEGELKDIRHDEKLGKDEKDGSETD